NNYFCSTTSQLAYALPCQTFYSDIFQIIDAGPSVRRSMLDWGLFHVKREYLFILKEYKKVLQQRNALLKKHAPYSHFIPWDKQLSDFADQLHQLRENYFQRWQNEFIKVLNELTDLDCKLIYLKGWDRKNTGKNLEQILVENFNSDQQKFYTQYGAHQADILIETDRYKAKHVLSRGQQKIILFAMKMAQSHFLDNECLYLIDDLSSELDEENQRKIIIYLSKQKGQFFITTTSQLNYVNAYISTEHYLRYHIDEGILKPA
ncbi:MAG: DNA replication and repair protein RecF, partial [Legionella longbeachae]|nr:DNA replication and repair protein RecF [Legionella longbeachae]